MLTEFHYNIEKVKKKTPLPMLYIQVVTAKADITTYDLHWSTSALTACA